MLINLNKEEVEYLENMIENDLGAHVICLEMAIFDKIRIAKVTESLVISYVLNKLVAITKAECNISKIVSDFLNCLIHEYPIDLSELGDLDAENFAMIQLLLSAIRGKKRFMIQNYLNKLRKQGEL
jgi:hypothetical protein